ncbi:MAG: type II toxin-antitoxin system RelE/ParE family toxin [Thermoanaerobaculia bacterium]
MARKSLARDSFGEEIESAFALLREVPRAGEPVPHGRIPNLRRLLLSRIRYFLYYSDDEETHTAEVLALWHTSRGQLPRI